MTRRRVRLTALAAAVVVLSSGCTSVVAGQAVRGNVPPIPVPVEPIEVPDGFDETPEVKLKDGKPGGTFQVADFAPVTLKPGDVLSGPEMLVAANVFTALTRIGPDLKTEPGAAESWESGKTVASGRSPSRRAASSTTASW